jgi:hypothetical protein
VKRREEWRPVLEAEMKRWSAMSCNQLISALTDVQAYEVEFESKRYQIEVELLENTESYLHVGIAVDDGHFWRAMYPLSSSFICKKTSLSGS